MAQYTHSLQLKNPKFPLYSADIGQSVLVGTSQRTKMRDSSEAAGVVYAENVIPTLEGYVSIEEDEQTGFTSFQDEVGVKVIYGDEKTRLYLSFSSHPRISVLKDGSASWTLVADPTPSLLSKGLTFNDITTGRVNGISYIWFRGVGCYTYDETTDTLVNVTLTGLTISEIVGITASSGYLIAYTDTALAWSSTVDPTDFTPSDTTGAGGGEIAGIGGDVKFAFPNPTGVLIYSDTNIISASYTGNTKYPFKFREVAGARGLGSDPDIRVVAYEDNSATQYAFTTAGIQAITAQKAELILPEVVDFISGRTIEYYSTGTNDFVYASQNNALKRQLALVGNRYLIISYGLTAATGTFQAGISQALIYDIALGRIGKYTGTTPGNSFVQCIEFTGSQGYLYHEGNTAIAFQQANGKLLMIDKETTFGAGSIGVLLLGKFQYSKGRHLYLLEVELDTVPGYVFTPPTVIDLKVNSNKEITAVAGTIEAVSSPPLTTSRRYFFNSSAEYHIIAIKGSFKLNTVNMVFKQGGRR